MFSFETVFEGIKYTVYFFGGFTGIIQPFTPEDPIALEEIYRNMHKHNSSIYVQGWYTNSDLGPRLDILKKIYLIAEPFDLNGQASKQPGTYYHRLVRGVDGSAEIGVSIDALEAIHEVHYLRYVINGQGSLESAFHIYNNAWDINYYKYNEQGRLIDRKVEFKKELQKIPGL